MQTGVNLEPSNPKSLWWNLYRQMDTAKGIPPTVITLFNYHAAFAAWYYHSVITVFITLNFNHCEYIFRSIHFFMLSADGLSFQECGCVVCCCGCVVLLFVILMDR